MTIGDPHFDRDPAFGAHGAIAASNETAAAVGRDVLASGGNAIDAAVAVSLTLGVVEAFHSGIGGGGFITYFDATSGRVSTIDARGVAPAAAHEDMFVRDGAVQAEESVIGHRSVVVPGLVAGLALAHRRWGTRPLLELVEPAARLAEDSFAMTPIMACKCDNDLTRRALAVHPEGSRIYLRAGRVPPAGTLLRNPDLASSYRLIGREGAEVFYRGEIGRAIAEEMTRGRGLMTAEDLAGYRPREFEPVRARYRGYEVAAPPPPSAGGTVVLQTLRLLDGFPLGPRERGAPATLHLLAEAMKLAFADRNHYLGDPAFVDIPLSELLSDDYIAARRALIHPDRALKNVQPGSPRSGHSNTQHPTPSTPGRDSGTTSFSIADRYGNLLALTQTIGMNLASGVVVPGTGIVLNHTMSDFSPAVGVGTTWGWGTYTSRANAIAPGKAPLSSMAPTLVFKDGQPWFAVGAAGGSGIPTAVLQAIVNVIDFGMDPQTAVSTPRIHDQGEGLQVERFWFDSARQPLVALGHRVGRASDYRDAMSNWAQAVMVVEGGFQAGADPRADGLALGIE